MIIPILLFFLAIFKANAAEIYVDETEAYEAKKSMVESFIQPRVIKLGTPLTIDENHHEKVLELINIGWPVDEGVISIDQWHENFKNEYLIANAPPVNTCSIVYNEQTSSIEARYLQYSSDPLNSTLLSTAMKEKWMWPYQEERFILLRVQAGYVPLNG